MKRFAAKVLIASLLCMSLAGCDDMGSEMGNKLGKEVGGKILESTGDYVYDYQVSMEPIPKEIADLGGPCQGTIHAFPSKIKMALTEQKMEEDPELKAEVEKRKVEVEQYLEKEIGKDFQIEGVIVDGDLDWTWICTEVDTDYQFALLYANYEYNDKEDKNREYRLSNEIYIEGYYAKKDTLKYGSAISERIENVFRESFHSIRVREQVEDISIVEISIIQYADEVDKCQEQIKMLQLWNQLKELDDNDWYLVAWIYCPKEYKTVMEEKYNNGVHSDTLNTSDEEMISAMINDKDLTAYLRLNSFFDIQENINFDTLLDNYQKGNYEECEIWSLWTK